MPELSSQMYGSEQITIPPPFPYLLRQYSKAAIRTQPIDLLKWSTAYFRCLSLNIPPPVKPRLEYPIPRDYYGLTPGWLKALLYQFQNNQTITYQVLWDRWTGACLEHNTLIKILCLGAFDNPEAIPWLKFVAICAAHLTNNLTHSMILICEILTEEPEGGSAMIPLEAFTNLYKYLAKINASKPQILFNKYFLDSWLNLWSDRIEKEEEAVEFEEVSVKEEESTVSTITDKISEEEIQFKMSKEEISCASLSVDENYSIDYALPEERGESEEYGVQQVDLVDLMRVPFDAGGEMEGETFRRDPEIKLAGHEFEKGYQESINEPDSLSATKMEDVHTDERSPDESQEYTHDPSETDNVPQEVQQEVADIEEDDTGETNLDVAPSVATVQEIPPKIEKRFPEEDQMLREDLEKLKIYQQEIAGETDEEVEKYKCKLIQEMPITDSQVDAIDAFKIIEHKAEIEEIEDVKEDKQSVVTYKEVEVDVIPGIGPLVPDDMMEAVLRYMKGVATIQHGMVMPRNVRHYNCPPLEILEY